MLRARPGIAGLVAWMMAIVCGSESNVMAGVTKMEGSVIVLKVGKFGKSLGASARLHIAAGDTLYLTEAPGGYRITSYGQMAVATEIVARRCGTLRELARR